MSDSSKLQTPALAQRHRIGQVFEWLCCGSTWFGLVVLAILLLTVTWKALTWPAPEAGIEWAFSPQALAHLGVGQRVVLRVNSGSHYLEGVQIESRDGGRPYVWRDYDELRSLPVDAQQRRSVFGPDGFIEGTDRPEAALFWPTGVRRAGAMRQWGHHATAFVGRRHFDDAHLMEQRFEFDPAHFAD